MNRKQAYDLIMAINSNELQQLMEFAVGLAREAGEVTLRHFRKVSSQLKRDGTFVTAADYASERHLRSGIERVFPDDGILGEEEGERVGKSGRRWIIDPIDGTFSFVHGVPLYGVLIGLEIDGEPVIGVVNLPAMDEIVYAARGCGCFWNGERAHTSSTQALEDAVLLSTDFGVDPALDYVNGSRRLQRLVAARRTWGDCYGHLLVATGRADIMLDSWVKIWDCAALLPVIEEAGGTFTDWTGQRTIHSNHALSTNGFLLEAVRNIFTSRSS
jgi:histidinol-phosphatase